MSLSSNITNATTSNTYTLTNTGTTATTATINYNGNYITTTGTNYDYTINWQDYATTVSGYSNKDYIEDIVKEYLNKDKEKENKSMNIDFSFGPYNTDSIRLSMYGMAVKNKAGKWVSYDNTTHRMMDVEVFNISIKSEKVFFKLPKAVDKVIPGDIILHNGRPVFVELVREDGKFEVIDPYEGTAIIIIPTVSPFGFNFVTQIVSIADYMPAATADNPFGNLLPFLLGEDSNGLALAMLMNKDMDIDPMMLALMCSGKSDLTTFLLMKMFNKKSGPTEVQEY